MQRQGLPAGAKPARRKQAERRAAARFLPAQTVICYWSRNGRDYATARVCDLSAKGACLLVRGPIEAGTELYVEMINGPHTFLCVRTFRVQRVYQGGGRDVVIGGTFDRYLGYDEMLPFIL